MAHCQGARLVIQYILVRLLAGPSLFCFYVSVILYVKKYSNPRRSKSHKGGIIASSLPHFLPLLKNFLSKQQLEGNN